jgi:hypothetical protein
MEKKVNFILNKETDSIIKKIGSDQFTFIYNPFTNHKERYFTKIEKNGEYHLAIKGPISKEGVLEFFENFYYCERLRSFNLQFNNKLNEFKNNNFYLKDPNDSFYLNIPLKNLLSSGIPELPIILEQSVLRKGLGLKKGKQDEDHSLSVSDFLDFPLKLNNPIAVYEGSFPDSRVVLIEVKKENDRTIIVPIHLSVTKDEVDVNIIASLYSRKDSSLLLKIENCIKNNTLFYIDPDKIKNWLKYSRKLQLLPTLLSQYLSTNIQHSNNQSQEKSNNFLGAAEVLAVSANKTDAFNANFEAINFNGYKPKYKILPDYSHLIEPGDYSRKSTGEGFEATLKSIPLVIQKYHHQVRKLARHLYTGNYKQDAFNAWHFAVTNIRFKNDTYGFEELRSPARSWRDRFTGIDCDCFTNFIISLLLEMNYMPYAKIVAFNNKGQFGHIYTILNDMVIDPVMKTFNQDPPNITKTHKLMVQNVILNGLGDIDHSPSPYESEVAAKLMGYINNQSQKIASGKFNANDFSNLKKAQYMLFINPLPERELIADLLANHVKSFHKNGSMIFYNNEINGLLYGGALEGALNGVAEVTEDTYEELERIGSIFDAIDDADGDLGKLKDFIKKIAPKNVIKKTVTVLKKVNTKIKKIAKKVLVTYNPAFAIPRAAFLVLCNLNVFNLGFKLSLGYLTLQQFLADGGDASEYQKCVDVKNKTEKLFELCGGTLDKLRTAIQKGKDRKAVRVERRTVRAAKKQGVQGFDGLFGLGYTDGGASAAVGTSATFWGKILGWFKNINWKKLAGTIGNKVKEGPSEDEVIDDQELNPDGTVPEDLQQEFSSTGGTGFLIWGWVLIALGVVGVGYVALKK